MLRRWMPLRSVVPVVLVTGLVVSAGSAIPQANASIASAGTTAFLRPTVTKAVAFDRSAPLRDLVRGAAGRSYRRGALRELGAIPTDTGFSGDAALQPNVGQAEPLIASPLLTFEGLANADNPFQLSPPDPNGEVGPNHYVEMVNVVFAVYSKTGARLLGPALLGDLWTGFAIDDCTDLSGDPVVVYDQLADRWVLTQFTTRGPVYYDCVAVSQTGDPTGSYFRYAFTSGENFPDYPKYGVWSNAYFLATREFDPRDRFAGDGLYALERNKMISGNPNARMIKFLLEPGHAPYLPGDGLLPPDIDGSRKPSAGSPGLFVGSMDDGAQYHAPFDGLNVFAFAVAWTANPASSFSLVAQLPVAPFDSVFPCKPGSRECIPQPGTDNKIDILSYRQRPTFRLAYRNFGTYESFVTNQSVEARKEVAGVRWYEIRRSGGAISLYQQGTYAPGDGVNRWMGSIASDRSGDLALGFSVSNATTVYPGIRYTGRLAGGPLGEMTLGEGVLIDGSGSQLVSHRWGDYTDMTVDPTDDCTFWYVNEYYQTSSARGWQTRIGSFRLPGC